MALCEGGEKVDVSEENYGRFLELVEEFTCGRRLRGVVEEFTRGLFSVVEDGVWKCLTAREKALLITGDDAEVTMADLEANIAFEHGYDGRSPQKTMLLQIIYEFPVGLKQKLFMFITGCERLPIGGLGALVPKITVARRTPEDGVAVEDTLPTASTCAHYFKLPPYPSKEVMRERITTAVTDGCVGFDLS
jgi:E3 ubiquitin-protein ligase TRIP12